MVTNLTLWWWYCKKVHPTHYDDDTVKKVHPTLYDDDTVKKVHPTLSHDDTEKKSTSNSHVYLWSQIKRVETSLLIYTLLYHIETNYITNYKIAEFLEMDHPMNEILNVLTITPKIKISLLKIYCLDLCNIFQSIKLIIYNN